jgi:hypothetical protein
MADLKNLSGADTSWTKEAKGEVVTELKRLWDLEEQMKKSKLSKEAKSSTKVSTQENKVKFCSQSSF